MRETWLNPNRRAIFVGCILPILFGMFGAWLHFNADASEPGSIRKWAGLTMIVLAALAIVVLLRQLRRPRIAYENNHVLFYLRGGPPIAVPANIVESFFAGQSQAHLPAMKQQPQSVNLIARLSQRHTEWAEQNVKPALGKWAEGYVTIRGTWCEPLNTEVIRRLNRRLKEVKDEN